MGPGVSAEAVVSERTGVPCMCTREPRAWRLSEFGPKIVWFHLPRPFLVSEISSLAIVAKS